MLRCLDVCMRTEATPSVCSALAEGNLEDNETATAIKVVLVLLLLRRWQIYTNLD